MAGRSYWGSHSPNFPVALNESMARSQGYRATGSKKAQILELRKKLGSLTIDQWAKAQCVMDEIVRLLGRRGGPSGSSVAPRVCKGCGFFGHTKAHCKVSKAKEDKEIARELSDHKIFMQKALKRVHGPDHNWWCAWVDWSTKRRRAADEACEDCLEVDCDDNCERCKKRETFIAQWERENPAPVPPSLPTRRWWTSACAAFERQTSSPDHTQVARPTTKASTQPSGSSDYKHAT